MNTKQIEQQLTEAGIEQNEAKVEAKMFLKHFLKLSAVDLAINDNFEPTQELLDAINTRIKTRVPIQHIIGTAYFMGEDFIVNKNVLIPRDETEILVTKAVEITKTNAFKLILDIGTGSGCIACMVAKLTNSQVIGVDISSDALITALDNSSKLELFNKAIFRKSDLFSNIRDTEKFDMIISNPPYIPISEKDSLQKEVQYDPELALFSEDKDGIDFYSKIITEAQEHLNKGGYVLFELGINQSAIVKKLFEQNGFKNIFIEKDLAGIDRVIGANI